MERESSCNEQTDERDGNGDEEVYERSPEANKGAKFSDGDTFEGDTFCGPSSFLFASCENLEIVNDATSGQFIMDVSFSVLDQTE